MELLVWFKTLITKGLDRKGRMVFVMTTISAHLQLKKIKKKDMNAVIDWFDTRQSKFYKIAWAYLKNHHDVEDVFHNTIIKVHDKIGQLKEDKYFETWVTSIFINECRTIYRKRKQRETEISKNEVGHESFQNKVKILDYLDQLDEKYKEIILLQYIQGYSQQEVSFIQNIPIGTVKSRIHRGLKKLRKIIEGGEE